MAQPGSGDLRKEIVSSRNTPILTTMVLLATLAPVHADTATRPAAAKPKPVKTEAGKPLDHLPSGFTFPFNVGAFRRSVAYTFDDAGENLSVGYADPSLKIILTAYVYPSLKVPLDAHFNQTKADILKVYPKAKSAADGSITIAQGKRLFEGMHARYELRGSLGGVEQDLISEAYLFVSGQHFIKFRLTYPAADAKAAATRVDFFLKSLTFPETPTTKALK